MTNDELRHDESFRSEDAVRSAFSAMMNETDNRVDTAAALDKVRLATAAGRGMPVEPLESTEDRVDFEPPQSVEPIELMTVALHPARRQRRSLLAVGALAAAALVVLGFAATSLRGSDVSTTDVADNDSSDRVEESTPDVSTPSTVTTVAGADPSLFPRPDDEPFSTRALLWPPFDDAAMVDLCDPRRLATEFATLASGDTDPQLVALDSSSVDERGFFHTARGEGGMLLPKRNGTIIVVRELPAYASYSGGCSGPTYFVASVAAVEATVGHVTDKVTMTPSGFEVSGRGAPTKQLEVRVHSTGGDLGLIASETTAISSGDGRFDVTVELDRPPHPGMLVVVQRQVNADGEIPPWTAASVGTTNPVEDFAGGD